MAMEANEERLVQMGDLVAECHTAAQLLDRSRALLGNGR